MEHVSTQSTLERLRFPALALIVALTALVGSLGLSALSAEKAWAASAGTPKITCVTTAKTSSSCTQVTIKFMTTANANYYQVQHKLPGEAWNTCDYFCESSPAVVSEFGNGKTIQYRVKAVGEYPYDDSAWSRASVSINTVPTLPTMKEVKLAAGTAAKISWNFVTGAKGYIVQRSKSYDTGFKTIAKIKSGKTLSCVNKGLSNGQKYYYRVAAFTKNGASMLVGGYSYAEDISTVPSKTKIKSITIDGNNYTKITWGSRSGATGYLIQRSLKKSSGFKTVRDNTFSNSSDMYDQERGKTYFYRVVPYVQNGKIKTKAAASTVRSVKTLPPAVKIKSFKKLSSKSMKIKWGKVSGAKGYLIQKYTTSGWKTIKSISNPRTLTATISGIPYSTITYYRVAAYIKNGSKKLTSTYDSSENSVYCYRGHFKKSLVS